MTTFAHILRWFVISKVMFNVSVLVQTELNLAMLANIKECILSTRSIRVSTDHEKVNSLSRELTGYNPAPQNIFHPITITDYNGKIDFQDWPLRLSYYTNVEGKGRNYEECL